MKIHCMNCMEEYDEEFDVCPNCGYIRGTEADEIYYMQPETMLFDRYIVGTVVGFGGFGITYKAWDTQMNKTVAIKEFFPSSLVSRDDDGVTVNLYSEKNRDEFDKGLLRFLEEGKSTARFGTHPNIVNVFDLFEENNTGYIIMEFLEGVSLKEYIAMNDGSLDTDTTINILLSVIEALKAIHKEKVLHRDISPDNIFICIPDRVKLIDFGAARITTDDEKTMSVVLKPGYAPPEQYRNKSKQGPWTDIYALAATMYYTLTGVVPDESVDRVVKDELIPPKELVPDIPDFINDSLMVAMALNHELRFKNVVEFEEAILHQRKVLSIEADLKRRKRIRAIAVGVLSAMVIIGTIVSIFVYNKVKFDAELEATSITVWICSEDGDLEEDKKEFISRISEFKKDYPHVEVRVEAYPYEEYYMRLSEAAENKTLPDLFVSTYASKDILENTIELEKVFKAINKKDLYLLSDYSDYFPDKNQMPTGVDIAIVYESTVEIAEDKSNELDAFYQGQTGYLVEGTKLYDDIQMQFGGKYNINLTLACDGSKLTACFVDAWSVSKYSDSAKQNASERVISYLLGEMGQDVYYNQSGNGTPINKVCFGEYIKINWELNELEGYIENLKVDKNNLFGLDDFCDEKYQEIVN